MSEMWRQIVAQKTNSCGVVDFIDFFVFFFLFFRGRPVWQRSGVRRRVPASRLGPLRAGPLVPEPVAPSPVGARPAGADGSWLPHPRGWPTSDRSSVPPRFLLGRILETALKKRNRKTANHKTNCKKKRNQKKKKKRKEKKKSKRIALFSSTIIYRFRSLYHWVPFSILHKNE